MNEIRRLAYGAVMPEGWTADKILGSIRRDDAQPKSNLTYSEINLIGDRDNNWPVREQGKVRSTCAAFAVVAAEELFRWRDNGTEAPENLSEEFLYTRMREAFHPSFDVSPEVLAEADQNGGTFLDEARQVLEKDGLCRADLMPYARKGITLASHTEPLHPDALDDATNRRASTTVNGWKSAALAQGPGDWREPGHDRPTSEIFLERLEAGIPVVASFPVFSRGVNSNWEVRQALRKGIISYRDPKLSTLMGGHTVCIVGCTGRIDFGGGPMFLFRNSWGRRFAHYQKPGALDPPSSLGVGYGMISAQDVDLYCWEYLFRAKPAV